jgi:tRNA A37 threonylcarbamoyladenosine biosynthesis protein TsaE
VTEYATYKVLLDDPASDPGLGFDAYASAFTEIIEHSKAQFAIGIFGDWGSGKTTLMRAIQRKLEASSSTVTVWFNAWRYERESHLIVPLLDTLREALVEWGESRSHVAAESTLPSRARQAAAKVSQAAKALLAGITLTAKLPVLEATLDPSKILDAVGEDSELAEEALSFYHAGFNALSQAIEEFSQGGVRRVVIFVDDLDRCLPLNALEVLESMKLFFDLEGVIFVAGLDQAVVERSIQLKYQLPGESDSGGATRISGSDYVKKVFQVPFGLPRITAGQMQDYVSSLLHQVELPHAQRQNFDDYVRPHLQFLSGEDSVNPREVKRLINGYTLQLKMLSARLGNLEPNVVLALQTMSFRPEWRPLYEYLAADPPLFQSAIKEVLSSDAGQSATLWLPGAKVSLPGSFIAYLQDVGGALVNVPSLEPYVSSAEATHSSDPALLQAQTLLGRLRPVVDQLAAGQISGEEARSRLQGGLERLLDVTRRRSRDSNRELVRSLQEFEQEVKKLAAADVKRPEDYDRLWAERVTPHLDAIDVNLREMRRQASVGASLA